MLKSFLSNNVLKSPVNELLFLIFKEISIYFIYNFLFILFKK